MVGAILLVSFFSAPAMTEYVMTEYGIMVTKNRYAESLKSSVYDEALFRNNFNNYAAFLKQTNEKDAHIVDLLEQHFQQVKKQDTEQHDNMQNDFNAWQQTVKDRYFFKNMERDSVLYGIACAGLSVLAGVLAGYWVFSMFKNPNCPDDADGFGIGFLSVVSIGSALATAGFLSEGLNYTNSLQDQLNVVKERIKALNSNYAHMINNKEKLYRS